MRPWHRRAVSHFPPYRERSLYELESQAILADGLDFMTEIALADLTEAIRHTARPLHGLLRSINKQA
jgi:hypothetical protein